MSGKPTVYVNGEPANWHIGKVAVWPRNRFARFIHRRILKRPPIRYIEDARRVELSVAPPAGSHVVMVYPVTMSESE